MALSTGFCDAHNRGRIIDRASRFRKPFARVERTICQLLFLLLSPDAADYRV